MAACRRLGHIELVPGKRTALDHASVGSRFIDLETDTNGMGRTRQTRRRLLQMTGAMASMAVLAGCGDPDDEEPDEEEPDEEEPDDEEPDEEEPDEEEPDEEEPDDEEPDEEEPDEEEPDDEEPDDEEPDDEEPDEEEPDDEEES